MKLKHYPKNPRYLVSDLGQVFGPCGGCVRDDAAETFGLLTPKIEEDGGYLIVSIHDDAGQRSELVHRMVLETFVGLPRDEEQASHLNGVPTDCRLENLAWETAKQNNARKYEHGTAYNSANVTRRIRERDIETIFDCYDQGISFTDIGKRFGVNRSTIARVISGKRNSEMTNLIRATRARKGAIA